MRRWRNLAWVGMGLSILCGHGQTSSPSGKQIDRAVVATRLDEGSVYVGWRLLPSDKPGAGFNLYRQTSDGTPTLVNDQPVTDSSNLIDRKAGAGKVQYAVEALADHHKSHPVTAGAPGINYLSIPMNGNYSPTKVAVADLDGDGRMDYVIRQPGANMDPNKWLKSEQTFKLEAYNADGKFMWRHDMGWAIEQSMWCAPYLAYDCDGDGKAEVYCKGGDDIPRPEGKVLTGPEYLLKLDGMTGKVLAQAPWPDRSGWEPDLAKNTPTTMCGTILSRVTNWPSPASTAGTRRWWRFGELTR
jgi:rhamnogalacturonan endolyase